MAEKTYFTHIDTLRSYTNLSYVDLEQHEKTWKPVIDGHPLNRALTVFLPCVPANKARQHLEQTLGSFYEIQAPLSILLEPDFFQTYFKSGKYALTMHSLDTRLNTDNVVVLTPDGKLCLSLVKQTYETFGIEAIKRTKADMKHDKHIVMIDLKKDRFKPGSKEFNRLEWCLKNTLTCQFKMVFCATDILTGAMVDMEWSMSNITYIEKKEMTAEFDTLTDINIPSFSDLMHDVNTPVEHWDTRANEALEWLGLAHMKASRIKKNDQVDPFVSVYQTPASLLDSQIGTLIHFKGLLPTTNIHNIMTIVRKLMVSGVTSEWASITCWGYQDSPFTWSQMGPHYHYLNGENDYTFLLLPNKTAYVYQLLGSHHVTK